MLISISLSKNSNSRFDREKLIRALREAQAYKSKSVVVDMPLKTFLNIAEKVNFNTSSKWHDFQDIPQDTVFREVPYLRIEDSYQSLGNSKIFHAYGHEGRHRAKYLMEQGYHSMPVILYGAETRWEEENLLNSEIAIKSEDTNNFYKVDLAKRIVRA